jgi:hypothetical protein
MDLPILICFWLLQGSIAAYYAKRKGRNPYFWFAIGCVFGVLGIFAIFFIKNPQKAPQAAKPEEPVRKTLPLRSWYYLDESTQQVGPISTSALESAFREGKISPSTYVWHEGMENWKLWQDVCQEHGITLEVEALSAKC